MKCILVFASLFLASLHSYGQESGERTGLEQYVRQKNIEVHQLWREKRIEKAVAILEELRATPSVHTLEDAWISILYNLACGYSLLGQKEKAISFFADAIEAGFSNYEHIQQDTDLDNIRDDPRFKRATDKLRRLQTFWESPVWKTSVREDLSEDEKVAGLSRLWSEVKYNFVYFDRVPDVNWDSLYFAYLPRVRATESTWDYYQTLQELCARLKDGHTNVWPPFALWEKFGNPPLRARLIDNTVVVVDVFDDTLKNLGVVQGVEILEVDGMPVRQYAEQRVAPFQCASTEQDLLERTYYSFLLLGPVHKPVELTFRNTRGEKFRRTFARQHGRVRRTSPLPELKTLEGNIAYVKLASFGDNHLVAQFDSLFTSIQKTDAMILDIRENTGGNSGVGWSILGYLTDKPFKTTQWRSRSYLPTYRAWGRGHKWYEEPAFDYPPNGSKLYTRPVVVLVSAVTASAAEDFCVAFDVMRRGKIIGEPTAGTTGQPLFFSLPGGGSGRVCTKHDRYPDGMEFVGVGIQPDIVVRPTVDGIRMGRDAVLETALLYLKEGHKH